MSFKDEEEVVISGIGGKFAQAESTAELAEKLFAGETLMTKDERTLTKGFYENLPEHHGETRNTGVMFDNTFFGISAIVANSMDPLTCQTLERTFEAVIDAGINPSELRGSNASVFSGTCHSDSDLEWSTDTKAGYGIMGRNRCMNSNRVSYWLGLNGTSVATDSGWTNGLSNLYLGWNAIKSGKCDTAIVSTASLQCHVLITMQFNDLGLLSPDGISRTFDDAANGTGRSSAVVVLVLQRASVARRSYASIGHIYSTCYGDRDQILNKPTQREWETLFKEFYEQSKIDVNDVQYIEAHGSSIREEDADELNAITEVFCKNRKSPLLIGCIKSNLGNAEAASSFCGVVKSLISLDRGVVPKNLNYNDPNSLCPGLAKGQLQVVVKNTSISTDKWIAVNSYGYGGTYAHIVLKANPKNKTIRYDGIPRLVLLSDRTIDYMDDLIQKVESVPFDSEFVGLLHQIHSRRVEKYLARGYAILPKTENPLHEHQVFEEDKRPIWFIFSGMGSQWPKMGRRLMDLPIFRESIEKSHKLLETKGLDLIKIITTDDPKIFENILHSFVGIAAIQIALVDILRALNITPDGLIGHSVGELGCAYADGCFTAEQMILAAYYRGRASTETELIKGSMAAVGKGYNDMKDQLPEGIEVACHNADDSCTLSGPVDLIHKFVAELKGKGIFARSVNVSNIAYHSRYIKPAAPKLLEYLKQVVPNPKPRSSKWISTSNPESKWNTELARYCSAEYHTNNLLSSVLFEEGSKHIPKNAICIEIAPHGLLQAILKRSLGENVTNIPLTRRSTEDPILFLLQAIGRMYMTGMDPCVINLYPKIEYPVSRGTHILHHLVHWHEQKAAIVITPMEKKIEYSFKNLLVNQANDGTGYIINGNNTYPISIFLDLAWELFAAFQKKSKEECPIMFQNFRIEFPLPVHLSEGDVGKISFQPGSGSFEIFTDKLLAQGVISVMKETSFEPSNCKLDKPDFTGSEIYTEIKRKGYEFGETFTTLSAVSLGEKEMVGEIPSTADLGQSIESMIQLYLLQTEDSLDYLSFPCSIQHLEISIKNHEKYRSSLNETNNLTIYYDSHLNTATCGGIKMKGLKCQQIPRVKTELKFQSANFLPFVNPLLENSLRFADFCFATVLDSVRAIQNVTDINILEVMSDNQTFSVGCYLQQLFYDYKVKVKTIASEVKDKEIFEIIISPENSVEKYVNQLIEGGFVLLKTNPGKKVPVGFNVIGKFSENPSEEFLFLKKVKPNIEDAEYIMVEEGTTTHLINKLKDLKNIQNNVYLVAYKEPTKGIGNFKTQMQAESIVPLRWVFILDQNAPEFDSESSFYADQLNKGLVTNVYNKGAWGGFYWYNFSESIFQEDVNFSLECSDEITPTYLGLDLSENLLKLQQVEYSGKVNGKKVMGITKLLNSKRMVIDPHLIWEVPESWSLEEAASTPLSYALAYYCLVIIGQTKIIDNVLITDGMTCIGQACIALALTLSPRVFVTVNNEKEAAFIKKQFPKINETDVMSHEDPNFHVFWKLLVKDRCAEVIINMLDGERFFSIFHCCGQFGRIFHFGDENIKKNTQLGSKPFLMSLGLYTYSPDIITQISETDKKVLHNLMADGIKSGIVRPQPRVILSFKELKKIQGKTENSQKRIKTLLAVDTIKPNLSYIRFDINSYYVIIGDETDVWIDIAEWLIDRSIHNIIVSRRDHSKRSELRIPHLKKHKNVYIHDHQNVQLILEEARKLGPVAAVYYISMNSAAGNDVLTALDRSFRDPQSHLVAVSKSQGFISALCSMRSNAGFPSTNFIWNADLMILNQSLEFMAKVNGRDSVIHVSPLTKFSTSDRRLSDLLPSSIDDFCDLGSVLSEELKIIPLRTLTSHNTEHFKEITPLLIVSGLQKNPVKILQPIVTNFIYPAACIQIPNIKMSIPKMASYILPEIIKFNKGKFFNIVGFSWGTLLAMELAKQLEELDVLVGLILFEGPILNAKALVTKSLESDLINLILGYSKSFGNVKVHNEVLSEKSWTIRLNNVLNVLNLSAEKEKDFYKGATFIYNNLQAMIDYNVNNVTLKGPLTIIVGGRQSLDDKVIWRISKSIAICSISGTTEEVVTSENFWKVLHGSAVTPAMSRKTIHDCSWPLLEDFMSCRENTKLGQDFQSIGTIKFSFSF